ASSRQRFSASHYAAAFDFIFRTHVRDNRQAAVGPADASHEIDTACPLSRQAWRSELVPIGGSFEGGQTPDGFRLSPPSPPWFVFGAAAADPVLQRPAQAP